MTMMIHGESFLYWLSNMSWVERQQIFKDVENDSEWIQELLENIAELNAVLIQSYKLHCYEVVQSKAGFIPDESDQPWFVRLAEKTPEAPVTERKLKLIIDNTKEEGK